MKADEIWTYSANLLLQSKSNQAGKVVGEDIVNVRDLWKLGRSCIARTNINMVKKR